MPNITEPQFQIFRVVKYWMGDMPKFYPWYDSYSFAKKEMERMKEEQLALGYSDETMTFKIESSYVIMVPPTEL